ncbi:MAG: hypothetical protein M5U35_13690 [Roseovarius sp.]|nr:hypothetical protein [Roseovarius sp.]
MQPLVAGDAGSDLVGAAVQFLLDEMRVGDRRADHVDHVPVARAQRLLGIVQRAETADDEPRDAYPAPISRASSIW